MRKLTLFLFWVLGVVFISAVGTTVAYYFDDEISRDNFFTATSLDFSVDMEKSDNHFQTFTQGGWGSRAHGNNPGVYRDANFSSAFPDGVVIGLPGANYLTTFTSAGAVENFLPTGSTPLPFTQDHLDPITTEAGVLAGQVLALTLNVVFDLADVNFAPSVDNLKNYIIHDSTISCDGMTVQEVLDEANSILGGSGSDLTPSQINECASWVNEKFDGGRGEDGLVPGGSISQFATVLNGDGLDFQYTVQAEKTGGDDDFCRVLDLEVLLEGATRYNGDLLDFVSSPLTYSALADEWEFVVSLPVGADVQGSCSFDFVFSGWQTTLSEFGGFSDIERVDDPVHSVTVVQEAETIFEEEEATTTIEVIEVIITPIPIVIEESTSTPVIVEEVIEELPIEESPVVIETEEVVLVEEVEEIIEETVEEIIEETEEINPPPIEVEPVETPEEQI